MLILNIAYQYKWNRRFRNCNSISKFKKRVRNHLPVNTWISTAEAIVTNGCRIVFCDVNLDDYSICLKDLKKVVK